MNVAHNTLWEVIVDDYIDSFEIDTSSHQVSTYENPDLTKSELLDNLISFMLLLVRMYHINVQAIVEKFMEKLLSSMLRLYED
jgi:hypothetical protein